MVCKQKCRCCGDEFGRPQDRTDLTTCNECYSRSERKKSDKIVYPRGKWW